MGNKGSFWCFLIWFGLSISYVHAQNPAIGMDVNTVHAELEKRGIDIEDFEKRLKAKGIDMESLSAMEPDRLMQYREIIEDTIRAMESEKKKANSRTRAPSAIESKLNSSNERVGLDTVLMNPHVTTDTVAPMDKISEIWGHQFFNQQNSKNNSKILSEKVPAYYILGTGDRLTINIWGTSQLNEVYEIGSEGFIEPERMPRIFVRGMSLEKAKSACAAAFRKYYQFQNHQFDCSLNKARQIKVHLIGELKMPGTYWISADRHALDLIHIAGGINPLASVRKIKIIRNKKEIPVDLYSYLINPANEKGFYLEENDYIVVPVHGKLISVRGAVNREGKYELLESEDLNLLIQYAGGLKAEAVLKTMQLDRYDRDRIIKQDIPYAELLRTKIKFNLLNGDALFVDSIKTSPEFFVSVRGEVRSEGSFSYVEGMKLRDLILKLEFTNATDTRQAQILRHNPDQSTHLITIALEAMLKGDEKYNILLQPGDELLVKKLSETVEKSFVSISGAARKPGRYNVDADGSASVRDLILMADGLRDNAWKYGYLFRKNLNNSGDLEILRIELKNIEQANQNPKLQKFDSLVVLSEDDFDTKSFVDIQGAINKPGRYAFGKGMTAFDLISLADGFNFSASAQHIDIFRIVIVEGRPTQTIAKTVKASKNLQDARESFSFELEPYDMVVVRKQPGFSFQKMVDLDGEVLFPGKYAIISPNERVSDLIQRAGGLTSEAFVEGATLFRNEDAVGYIVMDLKSAMNNYRSKNNFILKDQDVITVPRQKDLVRIAGETNVMDLYPDKMIASNNSIAVAYHQGKRAKYYINRFAAGMNDRADKRKITVEHANGHVEKSRNFGLFRISPRVYKGSVILVGTKAIKKEKEKLEKKNSVDWEKVLTKTLTASTAIFTMVLTYNSLK